MTASKPANREGRPRGPVRASTRTATDGRRCHQARQPPRSAPRSRRTESDAPTRVLAPRTPNFQGSQRGPVRRSRGPDRSSRPRARRTRFPTPSPTPRAPTGAGPRLKPPDREGHELRTGRDPGSPRTWPGTPWDTPARGSRSSPVTAPVLPLRPRQAGPRGQGLSPIASFRWLWGRTPGLRENPRGGRDGPSPREVSRPTLRGWTPEGELDSLPWPSGVG